MGNEKDRGPSICPEATVCLQFGENSLGRGHTCRGQRSGRPGGFWTEFSPMLVKISDKGGMGGAKIKQVRHV